MNPDDLLYAKTHEWVRLDRDKTVAIVGISHFAVEALTDLVYIELPEVGKSVKAGEPFGEIESVKAVSDLYAPVDGEVIEVNGHLTNHLEILSEDPYEAGWMVKIKLKDDAALSNLLNLAAYQKQVAEEGH